MEPVSSDPFVVGLDRFHGPLDLLLHLIRKQDVDIFDIPIARITEQFLAAIRGLDTLELERAGEFVEMAATLVRIKAQMLFPRCGDDEEDDPRADLVRRLLEYEHFREAADLMERAERDRARRFRKGYVPPRPSPAASDAPLETAWDEVWDAVRALAARLAVPEEPSGYRIRTRLVRMDEKVELVLRELARVPRLQFSELVRPWGTRMHAVMSLLACLELTKQDQMRLRQAEPFSPLWLYRGQEERDAA